MKVTQLEVGKTGIQSQILKLSVWVKTYFAVRKMQIQTRVRYHCILVKVIKIKRGALPMMVQTKDN